MWFHKERILKRMVSFGIVWLLIAFALSGCNTTKYVPLEKKVYLENTRRDTLYSRDSIYVYDSVSTSQKNDTIFRDRWHKKFVLKEIYKNKTDSFIKRDSIPVPYPVEKELSKWERVQLKYAVWSFSALCMVLVWLSVKLYRRFKDGKSNCHNKEIGDS